MRSSQAFLFLVISLLAPTVCLAQSAKPLPGQLVPELKLHSQQPERNRKAAPASTALATTAAAGYQFVPVTPCRVADTRNAAGAFGGPSLAASSTREFDIPQSGCGVPSTAVAYSLNVTVVPAGELDYLTLWPTGQTQPNVSTLNSLDGRIKANAAITPAGTNGGVSVYVSDATNVILDIDGYFAPVGTSNSLAFYPLTPCRVADTRKPSGALGGPFVAAATTRSFPVQSSTCNIPSGAQAYSLNVTALPHATLDYLTTWPTGESQPNVSTLNAVTGAITANAAIVPAGNYLSSGAVSIYVSDDADVVLDVNGYFAPAASGGLLLYPAAPCRALDTRGGSGVFSGVLAVNVGASTCAAPSTAQAYVMNTTVIPLNALTYLTLWPDGSTQPNVSTLNALDGAITSNMAIVPTANGKVDAYASDPTQLILDISSYFAPSTAPPAGSVTVDFSNQAQIIRGFGGSEAWFGPMPSAEISALYGMGSGELGLTIMRLHIAPTTWTSSSKTADTSAWTTEVNNGLAAQALGAIIFATPWTPPPSMKSNDNNNEGSLKTTSYADFANYLEAYVNYATSQGINLYAISMQNEPDYNPCGNGGPTDTNCYESCLWTAAQMDTWVANNASVLTTKLIMPESFSFSAAMSDPTLNDPKAVGQVAIVGGHIYGSSPYYYTLAESLNKDVWMTEHTVNLAIPNSTTQSITDAVDAAEEIHNSMTVGQYNAYVYWWLANSTGLGYYSGLIDTNNNPTYFGDALAQFSRFVRPGYYRYAATANPVSGVYVSAYAGNGHYVIVAINANTTATSEPFYIQNAGVTSLTPYQTTSSAAVAAQSAVAVSAGTFTYSLPPQSVTTFVQ